MDNKSENLAVIKINKELKENKNKSIPATPIAKYLIAKCEKDQSFTNRVMLDNKSLKECFMYVYSEVKKKLNGVSGYIADPEVYKMADDYFTLDKVDIDTTIRVKTKSKQEIRDEKGKVEKVEPKPKAKKSPKKEKVLTVEDAEQFTLFDL